MNDSTEGHYNIIIGRDLLTTVGIDIKFSDNAIEWSEGPQQGCTPPMVILNNYDFKPVNRKARRQRCGN